ncbi:LOW QUALITY PROTEIN: protein argonaute-2-like [Glossina fuscipes fuscipes]
MGKKNKQKQNQDSDNKQNQPQENPRQQQPEQKQKKQSGDAGNANQDGQRGQQPSGGGNKEQGKQQWRDGGQQRPPQGQSQQSGGNTRGGNEGRSGQSQQHQQPRQEGARGNQPKQQQQQSGGGQQDGQQRSAGGHQGQQKQQPGNQGAGKSSQQQQPARQEGAWGGQPKQQQQQPGAGRQDGQQRGGGQQDGQQRSWGGHQGQQKQQPGSQGQPKQQQPGGGQQGGQQRGGGQRDGQQRSGGGYQGQQKQQPGNQGAGKSSQQQQPARQEGAWGGQPKQQQQQPGAGRQDGQQRSWGGHQGQHKQQPGSQGAGRSSQQQQPARQEGSRANQQQSDGGQQGARAGQNRQQFGGQQQQPPKQDGGWGQRQEAGGGQRRQAGGGDGGGPQQQKQQQPYGQEGPRRGQSGQQQFSGAQQRPPQQQGSGFPAGGVESVPPYKDVSCAGVQRGSLGKQGVCEVNYLRMNIDKMSDTAYHYDVTITPDRPKKFLRPVFDQCQRQYFKDYVMAYDGSKSCYSIKRLPKKSFDYEVEVPDSGGRTKSFTIQIKETDIPEIDLASLRSYHNDRVFDKPMRALQALEVVLASNNHALGIRVGRSFYRKPAEFYDLGDGYEMYTGIYQAAILGEVPLLNVDISHKSFPKTQPIIQYLKECGIDTNRTIEDYRMKKTILQFLKGIDIVYAPPASFGAIPKKKMIDIGDAPAKTFFTLDDGTKMNVKDYFASKGCILQYPYLNCITTGSTTRKIALPIEFCSVAEDQVLNRKDGNMQVSKMIKYSATSTNERKNKIMNLMAHFRHNENSTIRSFGIQLGGNFIKVHFRLLPPPELEYCGGKTACPRDGAWQLADVKFLETSKVNQGHKWAIVYENKGRPINAHSLEDFKKAFQRTAQQVDVKLAQEGEIRGFQNIDWVLQDLAKEGYALVIVVLPNYGTSYSSVKQNAELKVGILTQCIKERTVLRAPKDASVIHNLMLKVNAKLNGTNHKVSEEKEAGLKELLQPISNVMFMGADVTHPSPDQRHIPSVVGVAASHDAYGACYNMQYRLQRSTVEEIEDMKSITEYHLNVYKSYQNRYPAHIIYYRDGVSDGQFPKIKKDELGGIRRACDQAGCNPKITCLIVVKRHHTRFFPLRQSQGYRDFNNVEPGTVVDQYIVHPNEKQFFLVSHKAVQGTAKPTRYNVIEDDANFNIDLLQKLSYNLCHMFPRCNRAVSYPAPAYLAHLVAFRGRVYLEGTMRFGNLKDEYKKRSIQSVLMKQNPMYFV